VKVTLAPGTTVKAVEVPFENVPVPLAVKLIVPGVSAVNETDANMVLNPPNDTPGSVLSCQGGDVERLHPAGRLPKDCRLEKVAVPVVASWMTMSLTGSPILLKSDSWMTTCEPRSKLVPEPGRNFRSTPACAT
jgi:hypothetical protein